MLKQVTFGVIVFFVFCSCKLLSGDAGVIFWDDFSNPNSGWGTWSNEDVSVKYQKGEYVFRFYKYDTDTWSWPDNLPDISDVSVTFEAKNPQESPFLKFGVYCNYLDNENFYLSLISTNGYYRVTKRVKGVETVLTPMAENEWAVGDIPKQAALYKYRVECAQGTLSLHVNDNEIVTINDDSLTRGEVRLYVGYFGHEIGEIHFDNFEVKQR